MSRKLQTGDPDDAQFTAGGTSAFALAYWDADETDTGWTDAGHIQSSSGGWIMDRGDPTVRIENPRAYPR
jgi:hypothetical protein